MSYEKVEAKILLERAQLESAINRIIKNSNKLTIKQLELLEHTCWMERVNRDIQIEDKK